MILGDSIVPEILSFCRLSGLSPFLGDTDGETFSNVSSCEWDFDDECFDEVSKESKDFIENLLIPNPRFVTFSTTVFLSKLTLSWDKQFSFVEINVALMLRY